MGKNTQTCRSPGRALSCGPARVNHQRFISRRTSSSANTPDSPSEIGPAHKTTSIPQSSGNKTTIVTFLQFIRAHRYFYRTALKARREFPLKQEFEPLWEQVVRPLSLKAGVTSEQEMLYYFVGFQAGFTMILRRWVEQGCAEDEEQIAQIIRNIIPSMWNT